MTPPRPSECTVCGFPNLRPEGHAEWCERVTALLLVSESVCTRCGKDCTNPQGLAAHHVGSRCVPTSASVAAPSFGSATGVEGAATNGAVGRCGDLVGEVKAAAPAAPTSARRRPAVGAAGLTNNAAR